MRGAEEGERKKNGTLFFLAQWILCQSSCECVRYSVSHKVIKQTITNSFSISSSWINFFNKTLKVQQNEKDGAEKHPPAIRVHIRVKKDQDTFFFPVYIWSSLCTQRTPIYDIIKHTTHTHTHTHTRKLNQSGGWWRSAFPRWLLQMYRHTHTHTHTRKHHVWPHGPIHGSACPRCAARIRSQWRPDWKPERELECCWDQGGRDKMGIKRA